jgi:hypothetical protein
MPMRRAFVIAGCTFAAGLAVGGACSYSAGVAAGADAASPEPAAAEFPRSGDAELEALRALAVQAPIDELLAQWQLFLTMIADSYPEDEVLWRGFDRISDAVTTRAVPDARRIASFAAQVIERCGSAQARLRQSRVEPLRKVR